MKKYPLYLYVIGVIIALVIVNYIAWSVGGEAKLKSFELLSSGFLSGMLAMYIAVHVYRWKRDLIEHQIVLSLVYKYTHFSFQKRF